MNPKNTYNPDYSVSPGEILLETLEAREIGVSDFAEMCGLEQNVISGILDESEAVTEEIAGRFEGGIGIRKEVWLGLESSWSKQF